jgi:serine/threonine protein kinase
MLKKIGIKDVDPIEGKETEFTVVKSLGHGNFGNVYIVTRRADQVDYALKQVNLPDDNSQKLFVDEAGAMRRLSHRNIVNLKDFWLRSTGGLRGYLLMELCESDLEDMWRQVKSMSVVSRDKKNPFLEKNTSGKVILEDYLIQGLTALEFMKHSGVIHSDIKPANLFIKGENDEEVEPPETGKVTPISSEAPPTPQAQIP